MQAYTTLSFILDADACAGGYARAVSLLPPNFPLDSPIAYLDILDKARPTDAIWCLRCIVHPNLKQHIVSFANFCASQAASATYANAAAYAAANAADAYAANAADAYAANAYAAYAAANAAANAADAANAAAYAANAAANAAAAAAYDEADDAARQEQIAFLKTLFA